MPKDKSLRRWDRRANFVEQLAGPGCHLGASPDLQWFASETWYRSNPVVLRLYRAGDQTPVVTLFETPHADLIWNHSVHVNPSFSRDGRRI